MNRTELMHAVFDKQLQAGEQDICLWNALSELVIEAWTIDLHGPPPRMTADHDKRIRSLIEDNITCRESIGALRRRVKQLEKELHGNQ